jgi:hypothetical protein
MATKSLLRATSTEATIQITGAGTEEDVIVSLSSDILATGDTPSEPSVSLSTIQYSVATDTLVARVTVPNVTPIVTLNGVGTLTNTGQFNFSGEPTKDILVRITQGTVTLTLRKESGY